MEVASKSANYKHCTPCSSCAERFNLQVYTHGHNLITGRHIAHRKSCNLHANFVGFLSAMTFRFFWHLGVRFTRRLPANLRGIPYRMFSSYGVENGESFRVYVLILSNAFFSSFPFLSGAMIGSIICFKVGDYLGRRRELLIASFLFLWGAIIESSSGSSIWSGNWGLVVLMTGRIAYGIGCGFAMHGVSTDTWYVGYGPFLNPKVSRERERSAIGDRSNRKKAILFETLYLRG